MKAEVDAWYLYETYLAHKKWIDSNRTEGHQAILYDLKFTDMSISKWDFTNAVFVDCVFYGSSFDKFKFRLCNFTNCEFVNISIDKSGIFDCLFKNCELRFSSIKRSAIFNSLFDECSIYGNDITNNTLFNNSVYEGSIDEKSMSDVDNAKKVKFKYEPGFIKALTENSDNPYDVIETLVDFDDTEDYSGE